MIEESQEATPHNGASAERRRRHAPQFRSAHRSTAPNRWRRSRLLPECSYDDFAKVDLRVARVVAAEEMPEAKKLLKLTLSLGGDSRRTCSLASRAPTRPSRLGGAAW